MFAATGYFWYGFTPNRAVKFGFRGCMAESFSAAAGTDFGCSRFNCAPDRSFHSSKKLAEIRVFPKNAVILNNRTTRKG